MKYAYAIVIVLCLLSSTSWSKNPMIRNCNIAGGEFTVVQTANDQLGLCKFDQAYVGSLDVMFLNDQTSFSLSFMEYTQQQSDCSGSVVKATILATTIQVELCQYSDNSLIDTSTLKKGVSHSDNAALNKYLGL